MQLPRGIRNNNFGNIEDGPFARGLMGYSGTDGRFATFASPQDGLNAHSELLRRYGAKGINSVQGIINRWAPASDGNDTGAYAGYVAKQLGIGPNDTIDLNDPDTRQKLSRGMAEFENGPNAIASAMGGEAMPASAQLTAGTAPPNVPGMLNAGPAPGTQAQGPDWDRALMGAASSLMAIGDPKGAAVLVAQQRDKEKDQWQLTTLPDGRVVRYNHRTGAIQQVGTATKPVEPPKPAQLNESGLKSLIETETKANGSDWFNKQAEDILKDVESGKLDLSLFNSWISSGRNLMGASNEQSKLYSKFESFKELLRNEQLLRAKGVQTEGDAVRALNQYFAGNSQYDNGTAAQALRNSIELGRNDLTNAGNAFKSHSELYPGSAAVQGYITRHDERMKRYNQPAKAPAGNSLKAKYGLE